MSHQQTLGSALANDGDALTTLRSSAATAFCCFKLAFPGGKAFCRPLLAARTVLARVNDIRVGGPRAGTPRPSEIHSERGVHRPIGSLKAQSQPESDSQKFLETRTQF